MPTHRFRSKPVVNTNLTYSGTYRFCNGTYVPTSSPASVSGSVATGVRDEEWMDDYVGFSKTTKSVSHWHERFERLRVDDLRSVNPRNAPSSGLLGSGTNVWWWSWGSEYPTWISASQMYTTEYSRSVDSLLRKAMRKFSVVNQADNLLNAIESPQLISGIRDLFSSRNWLSKSVGAYLGYSFGVAPLLSDIETVNRAARTFSKDLKAYIDDFSKPFTATAQCKGTVKLNSTLNLTGYNSSTPLNNRWFPVIGPNECIRTVGVKGYRNIGRQDVSDSYKKLDYLLSRYVTTGPASFVWERVPYSFVVDWFVDLSSIVSALDNALTGTSQNFTDGWVSESSDVYIHMKHLDSRVGGWIDDQDNQIVAYSHGKYYTRNYLAPHITVGLSDRFGKKQAALSAALLYQMVAKLRG